MVLIRKSQLREGPREDKEWLAFLRVFVGVIGTWLGSLVGLAELGIVMEIAVLGGYILAALDKF